jgi:hypothetical protein
MTLLPARRSGSLSRPGSQAPARWNLFAEFEDLHQRMGQLMSGAFDGGWQEDRALRRGRRSGRLECRVLLPGHADPDQVTAG